MLAFLVKEKLYQVLSDGFCVNGKCERTFDSPITMAAVRPKGDRLVSISENNEIMQLFNGFKKSHSFTINLEGARITAVDMSADFIAVACFDEPAGSGTIFLLTKDMDGVGPEFATPSPVTRLRFNSRGTEVFAASRNGAVRKLGVSKRAGLTSEHCYLFCAKSVDEVVGLEDDTMVFLCDGQLILCTEGRAERTAFVGVASLCGRERSICCIMEATLYVLTSSTPRRLEPQVERVVPKRFMKLWEIDNLFFGVTETSVDVMENMRIVAEHIGNTRLSAVSADLTVALVSGTRQLQLVRFVRSDAAFVDLGTRVVGGEVQAIAAHGPWFVMAIGLWLRLVRVRGNRVQLERAAAYIGAPVVHLESRGNLLWTCTADSVVSVYRVYECSDGFEMCCSEKFAQSVILVRPFDDCSAALALAGGRVVFVAIPNDAAHGMFTQFGGQTPRPDVIATFSAVDSVKDMLFLPGAIVYAAGAGVVGALLPLTSRREINEIAAVWPRLHRFYRETVGFSRPSETDLDVMDLNIIETCQRFEGVPRIPADVAQSISAAHGRLPD
jgi:hypothetical protein